MIPYTGNPLDRKSDLRQDPAWVAARRAEPTSLLLPLKDGMPLFAPDETGAGMGLAWTVGGAIGDEGVFLGLDGGAALFAYDVGPGPEPRPGQFADLRRAAPLLSLKDLAIAAEAKALIEWHRRNGFCCRCGHPTKPAMGGHMRACPACHTQHFPRVEPAVIMLVTHGGRCLLARNVKWEEGRFSTLAGFVEPGEGLEEAVVREIHEEVGVAVTATHYFASQPWPYPAALMLGFTAECADETLTIDGREIAEAAWFTREEAAALLAGTHPTRHGPMTTAIAHKLISGWISEPR